MPGTPKEDTLIKGTKKKWRFVVKGLFIFRGKLKSINDLTDSELLKLSYNNTIMTTLTTGILALRVIKYLHVLLLRKCLILLKDIMKDQHPYKKLNSVNWWMTKKVSRLERMKLSEKTISGYEWFFGTTWKLDISGGNHNENAKYCFMTILT